MPVTNENCVLCAEFEDGSTAEGESFIGEAKLRHGSRISRVFTRPEGVCALPDAVSAIDEADIIVIGPGSLYTSIIPNLLADGISHALARSRAVKIYVCNLMTQPGETEGYTVSDHIRAIFDHAGRRVFDYCIINSAPLPLNLTSKYAAAGAGVMEPGRDLCGVEPVFAEVAAIGSEFARHDPERLGREIMRIFRSRSQTRLYER